MAIPTQPLKTKHIGSVENWQSGKTVQQCNLRMLQTESACDISFLVGGDQQMVSAHRFVLISRSCVFAAILSDALKDDADMAIPDIDPEDFHSFLVYLYTNDTDIDPKNATSLLYAARKYGVGGLEDKCVHYLKQNLSPKNACIILEAAYQSNQTKLYGKAMKVILKNGDECLKSPGFLTLSQKCVDQIVRSDDLIADESTVFESVNTWSEEECRRQEKHPTPRNKRDVLGDALKGVRFTLMKSKYFVDTVGNSGLLAEDERLKIIVHNMFPDRSVSPFNKAQRRRYAEISRDSNRSSGSKTYRESVSSQDRFAEKMSRGSSTHRGPIRHDEVSESDDVIQRAPSRETKKRERHHRKKKEKRKVYKRTENRFRIQSFGRECRGREWEPLMFRCREEIQLFGFLMFGPCDDDVATYDVEAHLADEFGEVVQGTTVDSQYNARKEDVFFEVIFPTPVNILPRKWYTLNVLISGPPSMYGSDLKDRIVSHGVTFEFQNVESHAQRNNQNQVPYLLFRN